MLVIFAGRGLLLVRIACVVLLPFVIFVSLVLYFSGTRWSISIVVVIFVFICFYRSISDRITLAAADGGGLPVQLQPPVPEVVTALHAEPVRPSGGGVHGLGASAIAALPAYAYQKKASGADDDCAVCLGELQRGEVVKQLPACAHLFHDGCIDAWLRSHVTCPVCRFPVNTVPAAAEIVVRTR